MTAMAWSPTGLAPGFRACRRRQAVKPEDFIKAIVVGSVILVAQHLLADEEESWLKRMGLWPRE